ncbi:MAG: hypothetical protein R3F14_04555 [Polyangiaceae bacterium]
MLKVFGALAGYPMVRMVAAMALRSRLLAGADFAVRPGELTYSLKVRDAIPEPFAYGGGLRYFSATWLLGLLAALEANGTG